MTSTDRIVELEDALEALYYSPNSEKAILKAKKALSNPYDGPLPPLELHEKVISALKLLMSFSCPKCGGDCSANAPAPVSTPVLRCPMEIGQRALTAMQNSMMNLPAKVNR